MSLYAYSVAQLKNKVIIIKNGCKVTNYLSCIKTSLTLLYQDIVDTMG